MGISNLYIHQQYMRYALQEALCAYTSHEVPIGSIIVDQNHIVGRGYNTTLQHCDPTAHAEINAIRDASQSIKNHRLTNATLYTTLTPCMMCIGAIIEARIASLIIAAHDPHKNLYTMLQRSNIHLRTGIYARTASFMLKKFFQNQRSFKKTI